VRKHPLKYRDLLAILEAQGCIEDPKRGKGSHRVVYRMIAGVRVPYTIPCHRTSDEIPASIIEGCRRRLALTEKDGVPDSAFY